MMSETILLVEDEKDIREYITYLLEELGFTVVETSGANQAIEKLKAQDFRLVLSDYNMPDGNGALLYRWLCENRPQQRMVYISSQATVPEDVKLFPKPVSKEDILKCIESA